MKIGTRVKHDVLGCGLIVNEKLLMDGYVMVKWDKRPGAEYNAGLNPCQILEGSLGKTVEVKGKGIGKDEDFEIEDYIFM